MVLGTGSRRCAEFEGACLGLGGPIEVMDMKRVKDSCLSTTSTSHRWAAGLGWGAEACTGEYASQIRRPDRLEKQALLGLGTQDAWLSN